ncbi:DUF6779 domain-containing protein [Actinophytocola algeriensis]|uniref:DUF6779 domain-containing protein n=1 Tax=Actinophytocola algeriensis TaxID=1768010 RepID=A0A7W7Q5E8_9PSEU|nr:DUF6779 domain-containing protein [Actinophytocola algeriensis]MBB4907222.1 hypothetical protein [Actinophytocola algeriensis]MBE1478705.1 hypothetical protein [Actinophytocola algeriensis]
MNARRDSSDEPEAGSSGGRVLLAGAVLFALAATGLLVLTDEEKWLRLGIVAALWAALGGAFVAARYRKQVADQREAAAERQKIYELELEREVAARREYELEVAAEAKRQAEEEARDDIAVLRDELQKMRQTLESLLGGEFLVERYALRAESTRMRSLGDDRAIAVPGDIKRLTAARSEQPDIVVPPVVREAETEMIERIREVHQKPRREPHREQPPHRPEPKVAESRPSSGARRPERPARPDRPTPEPVQPAKRAEPVKPAKRAEPAPPAKRPEPAQPAAAARQQEQPTRYVEHPAEVSDRWFIPEGLADSGAMPTAAPSARRQEQQRRAEQPRRPEPKRPADPPPRRATPGWDDGEPEWGPSWETRREESPNGAPFGMTAEQTSWLAQYNQPQSPGEPTYSSRAYVPPVRPEPSESTPEQVLTDRPSRRSAEYRSEEPPAGRRHRAEESGGGRRRRAEGQPSWQETVGQQEEPTGSHAAGRSVSELLANHGLDSSPRRRRRRED